LRRKEFLVLGASFLVGRKQGMGHGGGRMMMMSLTPALLKTPRRKGRRWWGREVGNMRVGGGGVGGGVVFGRVVFGRVIGWGGNGAHTKRRRHEGGKGGFDSDLDFDGAGFELYAVYLAGIFL